MNLILYFLPFTAVKSGLGNDGCHLRSTWKYLYVYIWLSGRNYYDNFWGKWKKYEQL